MLRAIRKGIVFDKVFGKVFSHNDTDDYSRMGITRRRLAQNHGIEHKFQVKKNAATLIGRS